MLRWWWPGGAVDAQALIAQLRGFAQAGWGGVEIQPCRVGLLHGLPHGLPAAQRQAVHEVFTPAWFDTVAVVMAEAERLGMVVDVTFGSAWPFGGGPAITPELATQELSLAWTPVQGPRHWQGVPRQPERPLRCATWLQQQGGLAPEQALPPGWQDRLQAMSQPVAVLAVRGTQPSLGPFAGFVPMTLPDRWGSVLAPGWVDAASTVDLTDRVQADGSLQWDVPEGPWQIVCIGRFASDQVILEGAGAGPQLVLDHLKRAAFDAHAARVGDAALPHWAPHAGRAWRSVFVDSLEIPTDLLWTDDFAAEFAQRRGYALRPHLALLLQPGWRNCFQPRNGPPLFDDPDAGPRVRADYRLTVSELMIERLYAPLADWGRRQGVLAKVQAHGAPVDWLQAYGLAGIPETEDLAGGAAPHFLRVARSAAHIHGRPLVSGEAFCWLLEGLAVTPEKVRQRADAFYVAGIQQLVGHGASARLAGWSQGHPWYPFDAMEVGTLLDDANPWFAQARPLADYLARNQVLLQQGRAQVPVAVLAPLDLFAFTGAAERLTPPPWHDALQHAGYDWDWLNDHGLLASRWDGQQLVTPGGHRYQAVVLPDLPALRAEVAERLVEWAAAGLAVWACGSAPARECGWLDAQARDARVQAAMAGALQGGARCVPPSHLGQALRAAGLPPTLPLTQGQGCAFHVRQDGAVQWVLWNNPGAQGVDIAWPVATGQVAERWDAWSGQAHPLALSAGQLRLSLPAHSACWVRLAASASGLAATPVAPTSAAQAPAASAPAAVAVPLAGPWQLHAVGRGLGGRAIDEQRELPHLLDLSTQAGLGDFAGQMHYQIGFELRTAATGLRLDLGRVCDAVSLAIDGQPARHTLTEAPWVFQLDQALAAGAHQLSLTVANAPENARRDPARPGGIPLPGRRLSRLPTGLLGPVALQAFPVLAPPLSESTP